MKKTSEVYKHLYHYTDWRGLLGILDSQSLWATHFRLLNDYSELRLFLETKLPDILYPLALKESRKFLEENPDRKDQFEQEGHVLELVVQKEVSKIIQILYDSFEEQIYITSFCGEAEDEEINKNGLLSQWRGYGQGGGFALVFDTALIEERLNQEGECFACRGFSAPVVYSHQQERYETELSDSIQEIAGFVQKGFKCHLNDNEPPDGDPGPLLECMARYKHRGFFEENEVRIAFWRLPEEMRNGKPPKPVEYRERNGEQVPYIELFKMEDAKLPIKKIIVGPHREKESRAAYLRTRLEGMNIQVVPSDIPYTN